jgi:acetyl esterase/lipase
MKRLIAALFAASIAFAANAPDQTVVLWPNGAPGSEGQNTPEVVQGPDAVKNFTRISNIHKPSLLVYLPPKGKATGVGVIVAPGGAHQFLVIEKEGTEVAEWLNEHGIAAFILKYRLARSPGSTYTVADHAWADAGRAVRTVRARAKEWGVDPAKIGFMGFSAGGEVAALAETRFDAGKADAADPIDRTSSRPGFAVVVYPGFKPNSITVPQDAPPTFLVCADNDRSHIPATLELYEGLHAQKVPAELHIYTKGDHGFGLRDVHSPVSTWDQRLLEWLSDQQIVPKP